MAAGRLGEWRVIEPRLDEVDGVPRPSAGLRCGWLPLRWYGLLAAVAIGDTEAVSRAAKGVVAVVPVSTRLARWRGPPGCGSTCSAACSIRLRWPRPPGGCAAGAVLGGVPAGRSAAARTPTTRALLERPVT